MKVYETFGENSHIHIKHNKIKNLKYVKNKSIIIKNKYTKFKKHVYLFGGDDDGADVGVPGDEGQLPQHVHFRHFSHEPVLLVFHTFSKEVCKGNHCSSIVEIPL